MGHHAISMGGDRGRICAHYDGAACRLAQAGINRLLSESTVTARTTHEGLHAA